MKYGKKVKRGVSKMGAKNKPNMAKKALKRGMMKAKGAVMTGMSRVAKTIIIKSTIFDLVGVGAIRMLIRHLVLDKTNIFYKFIKNIH